MELDNNLKKRFCKDFKLPINVYQEPYFTYFKDLYEPVFKIDEKLVWLHKAIEEAGGVENFFSLGQKISTSIKEKIMTSNAYKKLNEVDMNKDYPLLEEVAQQNIYIKPNVGKKLISIDLEKANFNCLDLFDLKSELGVSSYQDLMRQETNLDYYLNSKMIRQVIFGDLNPKRQQRLQKYIINQLCTQLKKAGCILSSASSDEIIVQNNIEIEEIQAALSNVPEKFKFFRIEPFEFHEIVEGYDVYVKKTQTNVGEKLEFKGVQGHVFAQVYKKYFGLEINSYDMLFYHEGSLAEFKEPYFAEDLSKKPKFKK